MNMNITKGKRQTAWEQMHEYAYVYPDTARRIYDRLRKRSYRQKQAWLKSARSHEAYVEGVRDALNGVLYG